MTNLCPLLHPDHPPNLWSGGLDFGERHWPTFQRALTSTSSSAALPMPKMRRTTASIRDLAGSEVTVDCYAPKSSLGSHVAHAGVRVPSKAGFGRIEDQLDVVAGVGYT